MFAVNHGWLNDIRAYYLVWTSIARLDNLIKAIAVSIYLERGLASNGNGSLMPSID
jgi:hypothetical protein